MARLTYVAQGALAGFLFGTASIFIRLLPRLDAFSLGFARLLLATIFMLILALIFARGQTLQAARFIGWRLPLLGLFLGLHFVFFISAVKTTSIVNATTLVNTTPAMAMMISWIVYGVRPRRLNIVGLALTLAGITSMGLATYTVSPSNIVGDLAALAGAFFWAIYLSLGRDVRVRANPLAVMPYLYLVSAITLAASGYLTVGGLLIPTVDEAGPVLAVAFFPTVLGHTLQFSSLRGLRAFEASTLALLEPVIASILAFLIFAEAPAPNFYLSATAVLAGIYLVLR